MSNPDSPGPYWPESAGTGRRGALDRSREDPYGGGDRYGLPAGGGNGDGSYSNGSYGNGSYANGSYGNGSHGNGSYGNGSYGNGYPEGGPPVDPAGPRHGRHRPPGPQDNGAAPDAGNGSRGAPRNGPGRRGARGSRGPRADAELRARLGLGSAPGAGPGEAFAAAGDPGGYDGAGGYGPAGDGLGDVPGYGAPGGVRGGTALRERGTATRTRGPRRGGHAGGAGPGGGGDGGPRPRRKGSWWRHWTWKKALAVAAGIAAGFMLLIAAAIVYAYQKTPIPTDVSEAALQQSSTVYFSNGKTAVGTFTADGIDRQMLASGQIPAVMKNAIVAAEDRHFYSEGGISITGILRSAYTDIKGGSNLQGGSTLTEEFAKNYYTTIGTSRTIGTKIKEIFVSIKLSHEKSKDWIMTQYLNTVPFGNNAYGVAAAAQLYFGEPAMNLTVSQAAMLAAMVNEPGFFSPDPKAGEGYTALVARWQYVLNNMVRDGALTQQQADAQKFPAVLAGNQLAQGWTGYKGYIMAAVQSELQNTYGYTMRDIDTRGLKIVTTFNLRMMNALYRAVNQNLAQMRADGTPLPNYAHVGAVLEKPGTGAILAMYGGPSYSAKRCGKPIFCQLNMAMDNREQVGSSFKPYVLATAVSQNMNAQNSILNGIEPMCVPPDSSPQSRSQLSTPDPNCPAPGFEVNIAGENSGPLSVQKAAAISSDPAFEDLVHRVGTQATVNMAKAFGVNVADGPQGSGLQSKVGEVGMALGIASLTVEEQATTFATLANGGLYVTPHVIAQITENGNTIPLKITHRQALTPAQAADVDFALSADTSPGGTAFPNGVLNPNRPTIGKTGTTDAEQSAFFLGAIPQYSLAVGMFTNDQNGQPGGQSLGGLASVNGQPAGNGGNWPATIWQTFMQSEFASLPVEALSAPDFNGFTQWIQVPPQPKKPNPKPDQCQPRHHHFVLCPPGGGGTVPPVVPPGPPGQPTPTPNPTPPFGGGVLGIGAVGLPLTARARRRRRAAGGRSRIPPLPPPG